MLIECNETCSIIFGILFPVVGVLTSSLVAFSPLPTVLKCIRNESIQDLNTVPFVMLLSNNISWILYSMIMKNWYIFASNIAGLALSLFYIMTVFTLDSKRNQIFTTRLMVSSFTVIMTLMALATIQIADIRVQQSIMGWASLTLLVIFYSSPLSSIRNVIRSKNSASIHPGLALTSLLNGSLWTLYVIFVVDWFIIGPNACGSLLAIFQLIIRMYYPAKSNTDLHLNAK